MSFPQDGRRAEGLRRLRSFTFAADNPELDTLLASYRGREVRYFANPGNGGDCLIAAATYQLFRDYDISARMLRDPTTVRDQVIFLAGGGNLVPLYRGMADFLRNLVGRGNRIIVLPHSIRGNRDLLSQLGPEDVLCCREVESHAEVLGMNLECRSILTHDLAIYLDLGRLAAAGKDGILQEEFEQRLAKASLTLDRVAGQKISCIRRGVEKTLEPKGRNYDVSIIFQTGVLPGEAERGAWMMLEFCRLTAEITTNRLHAGIAAALVGTPAILYDNSYGKVSGIYRHSLSERFANLEFRDHVAESSP